MAGVACKLVSKQSIGGVTPYVMSFAVDHPAPAVKPLYPQPSTALPHTYMDEAPPLWIKQRTILDFINRTGIEQDLDTFLDSVAAAVRTMMSDVPDIDADRGLTGAEAALLDSGGLTLPQKHEGRDADLADTAATFGGLLVASYSVDEAARVLGVTDGRIRQRLLRHTLYGIKERGSWRIPTFQFHHGRLLRGIEQVVPCLAQDLHPVEVYTWFTSPNADLVPNGWEDEDALSPRDWLIGGYPADCVATLAATL